MPEQIIDLGHGFWNIRGNLRLGGVLNVGTQTSLVRLRSGRFVFLDSYGFDDAIAAEVMALTRNGELVDAILNLHPFHTLHCGAMAQMFPQAKLYGSTRHRDRWPDLPWQQELVESEAVSRLYAEDLEFSLPSGIDYISANERIHAGSLLARHPASKTVHVDDTLNVLPLPDLVRRMLGLPRVTFHPTIIKALQPEPDAVTAFRNWAGKLARDWADTRHLCAAHSGIAYIDAGDFGATVHRALARIEPKLAAAGGARNE